jgi:CRP/FNR family transcriptional regulator, cyclic AMP receptor protein
MRTRDEKIERLATVGLFGSCSRKDLQKLARITDQVDLAVGTELCRQGKAGRECFVLLEGEADVLVEGQVVAQVTAGQTVGEMSLLDRRPQSATVVATTPITAYVIQAGQLTGLIEETPSVALALLRELSGRIRDLGGRYAASTP